jgi:hypothetical protein
MIDSVPVTMPEGSSELVDLLAHDEVWPALCPP